MKHSLAMFELAKRGGNLIFLKSGDKSSNEKCRSRKYYKNT